MFAVIKMWYKNIADCLHTCTHTHTHHTGTQALVYTIYTYTWLRQILRVNTASVQLEMFSSTHTTATTQSNKVKSKVTRI